MDGKYLSEIKFIGNIVAVITLADFAVFDCCPVQIPSKKTLSIFRDL